MICPLRVRLQLMYYTEQNTDIGVRRLPGAHSRGHHGHLGINRGIWEAKILIGSSSVLFNLFKLTYKFRLGMEPNYMPRYYLPSG